MALEREILARIQDAIRNEDVEQDQLYRALLGDLTFRKSQGLADYGELLSGNRFFTRLTSLPEVTTEPTIKALVDKVNPTVGVLDDNTNIEEMLESEEWHSVEQALTKQELILLRRAFLPVARYGKWGGIRTLGDMRKQTFEDLILNVRNVGPKAATIIMHSIQPIDKA